MVKFIKFQYLYQIYQISIPGPRSQVPGIVPGIDTFIKFQHLYQIYVISRPLYRDLGPGPSPRDGIFAHLEGVHA